jgi:hypothetical protein
VEAEQQHIVTPVATPVCRSVGKVPLCGSTKQLWRSTPMPSGCLSGIDASATFRDRQSLLMDAGRWLY